MSIRSGVLVLLLLTLASLPAARADWLYFRDGSALEIQGTWTVRGRQVRFTNRSNVLQMVPLAEVDLAVSEKLSRRAAESRGVYELRSSPDDGRPRTTTVTEIPLDPEYSLVIVETTPGQKGNSGRPKCVTTPAHAVTDAGEIVVQLGTAIETVELVGLAGVAAVPLRELVEGRPLCLAQREFAPGRDARGRYRAYAWLGDGREVALELLRAGAARVSAEEHPRRKEYQAAAATGAPPS